MVVDYRHPHLPERIAECLYTSMTTVRRVVAVVEEPNNSVHRVDAEGNTIAAAVDHHCRDSDGFATTSTTVKEEKPITWKHRHRHHDRRRDVVVVLLHRPFEEKPIPQR